MRNLRKDFLNLIEKYLNNGASVEETELIENYYKEFSQNPNISDTLNEDEVNSLKAAIREKVDERIRRAENPTVPIYRRRYYQMAAAILLFSMLSVLVIYKVRKTPVNLVAQNHDLAPGGNKAILTLANGAKINVGAIQNGALTAQPGTQIIKQNGQLAYEVSANSNSTKISYNTLTTPKGGQYHLILADGTNVWLNAASSLKYPTAFTGSERVVELTGEAYFEVVHNSKQPFKVKTANQTIQDIGTQFNVNAYDDEEASATTLVEGSVKIYDAKRAMLIKPGQQYLLKSNSIAEVKSDVDIDEIVAWKNGMFQFDHADIKTIMRQISRWYNVDVEYQGQIPSSTYHGRISRNSNASAILKILQLSGINFTIEGRKIIVK
jgi:ferric-dicitrate binding protein FerR (iron transport regulator)